jgi:hypothetical protein
VHDQIVNPYHAERESKFKRENTEMRAPDARESSLCTFLFLCFGPYTLEAATDASKLPSLLSLSLFFRLFEEGC